MALAVLPGSARSARADSEVHRVVATLRAARDLAVTQRRNIELQFPSATELRLVRQDVAEGAVAGSTEVGGARLESGFEFRLFPGVPDTPDGFGADAPQAFGGATAVQFTSEGTLVDQTGDPVNGSIFIGRAGDSTTAGAVTVLGVTGLVAGYRWNGRAWTR